MTLEKIKAIAQQRGIKVSKLKKGELVRAIQSAEGNVPCFEAENSASCGQSGCSWREICS